VKEKGFRHLHFQMSNLSHISIHIAMARSEQAARGLMFRLGF
jgi:hypothetical protein